MPGTSRYNLRPRRGGVESRPSSEKRTHQRGPVRSRGKRNQQYTAPTPWSKEGHADFSSPYQCGQVKGGYHSTRTKATSVRIKRITVYPRYSAHYENTAMESLKILLFLFLFKLYFCQNKTSLGNSLPESEILDKKRTLHINNAFVKEWLLFDTSIYNREYQTYDGWYNNPWHPSIGSSAVPKGMGSNTGEGMDVCRYIVPSRQRGTLSSRRTASHHVKLLDGAERWEAPEPPQDVTSQNWVGTEPKCTVTC
ncbi:hypothetical protein TNCV_4412191 [Trichonephila clavipes]|nr:hypothetical protein TNCV_4412191 [Trichonephila clavipes]